MAVMVAAIVSASLYAVLLRAIRRWQGTGYYTPIKVVVGNLLVIATGMALAAGRLPWGDALLVVALPHALCGVPILVWQAIEVLLRLRQQADATERELRRLSEAPAVGEGGADA